MRKGCCVAELVAKFIKKFEEMGIITRCVSSGWSSKVTAEVRQIVEDQMRLNDKMTAVQLYRLLKDMGYNIYIQTILLLISTRVDLWEFQKITRNMDAQSMPHAKEYPEICK